MKGFFSFIVFFTMAIILFEASIFLNKSEQDFQQTKTELIALENASSKRTIIENNVDKIIYTKLKENVLKNNTNVLIVQNEINSKLFDYLKNRAFASNMFFENEKQLNLAYLNSNSIVILFQTQEITYGEFVFTSNKEKSTNVSALIGNQTKLLFKIPHGYLIKVIN